MKDRFDITAIDPALLEPADAADSSGDRLVRPCLTYWQDAWIKLKMNRVALLGLIILTLYASLAVLAPLLTPHSYSANNAALINNWPSATHWFGTDTAGRDLWARIWMGARVSLSIGLIVVTINMVIGAVIGAAAGYFGGKTDMVLMRIVDVLYGIPTIIIAILLMVVMGPGVVSLITAMVCVGWVDNSRLIRGQVLNLKNAEYVLAAKTLGAGSARIILRHLYPNISGLIITQMTMQIPRAVFTEAFLSYIGIGVQAPACSWGSLAQAATGVFCSHPYQLFIPAFFICTTMLSLNMLGDGLRDALDPRMRGKY